MAILDSYGSEKNGLIIWIFEKHEIEFTADEFTEITDALRNTGLSLILKKIRPSLWSQLQSVFRQDFADEMEEAEFEFQAEQALLSLRSNLRI